jgi:hypothetical protein
MLENEGNFQTPNCSRLRTAAVYELDRFARHHGFNKHSGQVIMAFQQRVAGSGCPEKQRFGLKLAGMEAGFHQMPEQRVSYIFHIARV